MDQEGWEPRGKASGDPVGGSSGGQGCGVGLNTAGYAFEP